MRQVTREIRGAYLALLSGLEYGGMPVPIKGSMLNDKGATIDIGGGVTFQMYGLITNQFRVNNTIKNGIGYTTTLTLDLNTVFSGNSYSAAGEEWVEELTDVINDLLFDGETFRLKEFGIGNDRYVVTSTANYSQPMPLQYTNTSRVFRSVLIFEHGIEVLTSDEYSDTLWIKTISNG